MATRHTRREEDSEDLFDAEDDAFIRAYTQQRIAESLRLKEYTDEEELIARTETETLIVHFYKQGFPKCTALNRALASVAPRFPGIAFASIDATRAPRMVAALGATVLPLLVFFRDGFLVDRHVGFERLGNRESFEISALEAAIRSSNLLKDN